VSIDGGCPSMGRSLANGFPKTGRRLNQTQANTAATAPNVMAISFGISFRV